jgi:hypothetical protein
MQTEAEFSSETSVDLETDYTELYLFKEQRN